jgi:hypothetical protein
MDQSMMAGVGNIYRAEILFKAGGRTRGSPMRLTDFDCALTMTFNNNNNNFLLGRAALCCGATRALCPALGWGSRAHGAFQHCGVLSATTTFLVS